MLQADRDASKRVRPRSVNNNNYPYSSPSIASSASSSSDSIFSADGHSSQSSAPSSAKSVHDSWDEESASDSTNVVSEQSECLTVVAVEPLTSKLCHPSTTDLAVQPLPESSVAPELRLHPRRSQPNQYAELQNGQRTARPPPALVRQCDRKDNFVESLVGKLTLITLQNQPDAYPYPLEDTTTQMIEVIWPLSFVPPAALGCRDAAALATGGRSLIDLRTFVQEVLKRSKTSYSTLQVALYYLVLVKPHIPRVDFTREQVDDSHAARAMQCGRRMFLASMILASKYRQDRTYSARAWSNLSGLRVNEINTNERAFLAAVDYQIHVPEARFQKWTDVVLKYSLGPSSSASPLARLGSASWRSLVARLSPDLDNVAVDETLPTPSRASLHRRGDRPPRSCDPSSPHSMVTARRRSPSPKLSSLRYAI